MKRLISSKTITITISILTVLFLAGFYAFAWQSPTENPPEGNVEAPINTGASGQSKVGGLVLNTGDATHEPAENALIIDNGYICLDGECRDSWSAAGAIITYHMEASTTYNSSNNTYSAGIKSGSCPEGYTVTQTYCKSIIVTYTGGQYDACQCSVGGDTATLTAFTQKIQVSFIGGGTNYSRDYSCTPYETFSSALYCANTGPCVMEFQCGTKINIE